MSSSLSSLPQGLPNIGNTCWLNSVLQTFSWSGCLSSFVSQYENFSQDTLTFKLGTMIKHMRNKDVTSNHLLPLIQLIKKNNTNFIDGCNDSCECLNFFLQQLHEEQGFQIPKETQEQFKSDKASSIIIRDFHGKLSSVLKHCVSIITRVARDGDIIYETFFTIFLDLQQISKEVNGKLVSAYDINESLQKLTFASVPKCLIIKLIISQKLPCFVPETCEIQKKKFNIRAIIWFIPMFAHYIATLRVMIDSQKFWIVADDQKINMLSDEQMYLQLGSVAQPSLLIYE
jgi:ubiquitin C-terminal hydrolase